MPKNCGECTKYPMCIMYRKISKIIDEEAILNNSYFVFISIASHCKYYEEVIEDDKEI